MLRQPAQDATNLELWKERRSSGSHPVAKSGPVPEPKPLSEASIEDLENALVEAMCKLDQEEQLPNALRDSLWQFNRTQREARTHMRFGVVLGRAEYESVVQSLPAARARLVNLCLSLGVFG